MKRGSKTVVQLAQYADELNLDVVEADDYKDLCYDRRKIISKDGTEEVLVDIMEIPYADWSNDLKDIPNIEMADIMIHLLNTFQWSEDRLKNYKSDNGYKLYLCNHISSVNIFKMEEHGYVYLRAECGPETKQKSDPYDTWILVNQSGFVKSGGCTCVADDGSCKHVVAMLFACNSFVNRHTDRHTLVGTDTTCKWDKPRHESKPSLINDLNYFNNKDDVKHTFTPVRRKDGHATKRELELQVYNLCKGTGAGFLKLVNPPDSGGESDDESNEETITIEEMIKTAPDKEIQSLYGHIKSVHNETYIQNIETLTRGQRENIEWHKHRKYRLTASNISNVMHCNLSKLNSDHYLVKQFHGSLISFRSAATDYGINMEKVARTQYFNNFKCVHKKSNIRECGLFLSKSCPFLGASPDGIVNCKCCGTRLIEIKCSFKYSDKTPQEISNLNTYHVHNIDGSVKLEPSSPWYYQIQMQMGVCEIDKCDFILFTNKGISVETVCFDPEFYVKIEQRCDEFLSIVLTKFLNN